MSALSYSVALVYGRGHAGFSSLHWFFAGFLAAVARPAPYSPLCPLHGCAEALMTVDPLVLFDVWLGEASERSEERRVGEEGVRKCSVRGVMVHEITKKIKT